MSTGAIIAIIVLVVLVAAAAVFFLMPQMRSQRLRRKFGPEYDRVVSSNGDRRAAEKELADRERRHAEFDLHPIPPEKHEKYRVEWTRIQERFVEAPVESVAQAERLVNVVVADLGYPSEGVRPSNRRSVRGTRERGRALPVSARRPVAVRRDNGRPAQGHDLLPQGARRSA
ncbi:hypothetical protein [Kibdelosporangium aridum]|uniref:hypothetical protein n=1 Tax=Kibdelosporangium aridum TaxID=2030 RepID=UPI0035EC9205